MGEVDAHYGKWIPVKERLKILPVKGIRIKVLDYTIWDRQIFYIRNVRGEIFLLEKSCSQVEMSERKLEGSQREHGMISRAQVKWVCTKMQTKCSQF